MCTVHSKEDTIMKALVCSKETARKNIWALDLSPIMFKLMAEKDGKGWDRARTLSAVEEYRRFLYLTVTRTETIVPSHDADEVWHAHILDTAKYREDCQEAFGFFLDHFPYFGMRSDEDQVCLQETFLSAQEIERETFGSVMALLRAEGANCATCGPNACGRCAGSGITSDLGSGILSNVRPSASIH